MVNAAADPGTGAMGTDIGSGATARGWPAAVSGGIVSRGVLFGRLGAEIVMPSRNGERMLHANGPGIRANGIGGDHE